MKPKRRKLKIETNQKSYKLTDSCFYKLKRKSKLVELLNTDLPTLKKLTNDSFYNCFIDKSGKKPREIEHPLIELDRVHTRIASLLCRISQPNYMHSGTKGRSHISNASVHIGSHKVLTSDIQRFFPSTNKKMIFNFFHNSLQCSPDVSNLLADLCSCKGYLPTGSRISMPLAFWANERLFNLLDKVSVQRDIKFTVFVDDIVFSGNNIDSKFIHNVKSIISQHGHTAHPKKTKLYQASEIKIITGVAVGETKLLVANKHQKSIYQDITQWKVTQSAGIKFNTLNLRLVGKIVSQSLIDPRLKDKVRTLKSSINAVNI
jgi:hypothetical protein